MLSTERMTSLKTIDKTILYYILYYTILYIRYKKILHININLHC